tara:strand:- start:7 stop:996 length:990 start_codon:yes stop_codon:yes gene_type:complete
MRYLIIGGAGVFALHTIRKLLSNKNTSLVLSTGRNMQRHGAFSLDIDSKKYPHFIYKQVHLTFETDKLINLIKSYKINYIINFAALAHATSWQNSYRYYDTNISAVAKLVESIYDFKYLKQFLQIGSSEVYGSTAKPAKETTSPNPTSPYAVSKLATDLHLLTCFKHNGFPVNIIRPSNCYGPTQLLYRIIPKTILYLKEGKKFPLEGGGKAEKSFMHADDLANALDLILKSKKYGEIYNCGVKKPVTMRKLVEIISEKLNKDFDESVKITKARKTEDQKYWIDSTKIKKELGWKPVISIEDGIEDCINWVERYRDELKKENFDFELRA